MWGKACDKDVCVSVFVCVTHTHTHTHTYTHTHTHTHTHTGAQHTNTHIHTRVKYSKCHKRCHRGLLQSFVQCVDPAIHSLCAFDRTTSFCAPICGAFPRYSVRIFCSIFAVTFARLSACFGPFLHPISRMPEKRKD